MTDVASPTLVPDLARRQLGPELMDDPALSTGRHARALDALRTVNLVSGTAWRVWRELRRIEPREGGCLRVLDVACGGGDVVVSLARHAARAGVPIEVYGCDRSAAALAHARERAVRRRVEATFFQLDAIEAPLPEGYDLACSSLFLHHLTEPQAIALLAAMARTAAVVFVQDLRRTRLGWMLALGALHALTRSDVARADGPRSVRAAFTTDEAAALAREAGLAGARVRRCWPQRWALSWRRAWA